MSYHLWESSLGLSACVVVPMARSLAMRMARRAISARMKRGTIDSMEHNLALFDEVQARANRR